MKLARSGVACAVTVLLAAGLTACGSSRSGSAASSTTATGAAPTHASSSAGRGGQAGRSATQVLADAKSALFNAKAVHVTGSITDQHQHEKLDLRFQGQDTAGTITIDGLAVHIVKTAGTAYLKAPPAFWTKTAGPHAAALGGRWIKSTGSSTGLSSLTLQRLAAGINATDSPLRPDVKRASLHGTQALVLTQKDGSTLYVADATPPVPLRIVDVGKSKHGRLDFADYGRTQHISTPKGAVTAKQAIAHEQSAATL